MQLQNLKPSPAPEGLDSLALPFFFVLLYGSGFVGAKYGLPHSTPLSFLTLRFLLAGLVLMSLACLLNIRRPGWREMAHITIAGTLTVATFSIGVFLSIDMGLSPALSALIIALQPILVAVLARSFMGEDLSPLQWCGLILGIIGVAMVVAHHIDTTSAGLASITLSVIGLLGLTLGNLYQKRFCSQMNLFSGGCIQSLTSGLICLLLLPIFESYSVQWNGEFIGALAFMTIGVSIGALSLLYLMIRRGEVSKVASVFYLVPVAAAIAGYLVFGETFDSLTLAGAGVVATGVLLTNRG